MELDAEPAQKPLAKIRQAKRFLRAGEEIVAAAKIAQEEFWSDLLDGSMDERCQEIIRGLRKEDDPEAAIIFRHTMSLAEAARTATGECP